jgi:BASS family bile acid:Na+ symporter
MFLKLFPLWAPLAALLGFLFAGPLSGWDHAIVPMLTVVMLCMGLTLTPRDFVAVGKYRFAFLVGMALQFTVMPLAALLIALLFRLGPELTVGLVLVGSVAGGTASNVICYLARGDVALSITLTTVSTLLAVFLTPALTWLYVGQTVPVPVAAMLMSILKIVLLPVAGGVLINRLTHDRLQPLRHVFPLISVTAIVFIIAVIVALNRDSMAGIGFAAASAVVTHNLVGLAAGYGVSRLFTCDRRTARTLAIEVGMQNSGLGVALAIKYFSAAAAVPGALFSVWHNLSGSLLAGWWARERERAG